MDQNTRTNVENKNLPPCCQPKILPDSRKGLAWGIVYGIIPHAFCILFIVLSVIGAATSAAFFGKFLAIGWFFPALIALSFVFATISALIYLSKNKRLSAIGLKQSWKYLSVLYGTTLAVSLLFIYVIFPWAVRSAYDSGSGLRETPVSAAPSSLSTLSIQVDIPCSGHAPLIIEEIKKTNGVKDVLYKSPNTFVISYDKQITTAENIRSLGIFNTYKATETN
jgi:hypothetical protein